MEVGNAAIVARKNDLSANMVSRWVREHKNQNNIGIGVILGRIGSYNQSAKALESENEKLKKLLGEKDFEIVKPVDHFKCLASKIDLHLLTDDSSEMEGLIVFFAPLSIKIAELSVLVELFLLICDNCKQAVLVNKDWIEQGLLL